ncbi:probable 2-oxoglutarate-dependent dioxygenase ANS [Dendrobium catenatum]|uniref:Protein SRG1 n=1 Tax=Dendrobium catenatum TaxID=906689 RepID=A0A2I0XAM6_9ASPA|nr:probable 2-oxoglutarate-dependent dioxygenase ANS [Dendrobium catenatum]PKU84969.1 Protein SRG1 [Dendrobium catenatum]
MVETAVDRRLVQELARSGGELPAQFVQKEENRPIGSSPPASGVPIVDIGRLFESGEEALRLKSGLQTWGLCQVVSDELSTNFLDEVRSVGKKFFYLPKEEKLKYGNLTDDGEFKLEGYGNDIVVTKDQVRDWNDRLYLLVEPECARSLELWPDNPSSFRSLLHEYSIKTRKIADNVLKAIARVLELEENYFADQIGEDGTAFVRFTYYPACPSSDAVIGMKPHTDGSAITLLLLDKSVDGLQVLKDGEWYTVPTVPNALLLNLGDQMEIMSNGIFKSPMHRVVTNSQERISVVMFYSVNNEKYIEPANNLVDEERPRLYKKVLIKSYLNELFENFAQGKRAIDFAKV